MANKKVLQMPLLSFNQEVKSLTLKEFTSPPAYEE